MESSPATSTPTQDLQSSRRVFLTKVIGGSLGVAVVATGLGRFLQMQSDASGVSQPLSTSVSPTPSTNISINVAPTPLAQETAEATQRDRVSPAPGTRPEVTANKDFYRTDIDTLPLVIDQASWKLQITGLFDNPRTLLMADLVAYPAITQPITQSCISNPIGGDLISTSNWVGVL